MEARHPPGFLSGLAEFDPTDSAAGAHLIPIVFPVCAPVDIGVVRRQILSAHGSSDARLTSFLEMA